jgi:hypothetical protein
MDGKRQDRLAKLVPKVGPDDAGKLLGESGEWRNFARRIQRHPAILQELKARQAHRCPVCNCGLEGALTIHHVSYINRCVTTDTIELTHATATRSERTVKAPPCAGCPSMARCLGFLALVHNACHVKIHAHERGLRGIGISSQSDG